MNKMFIET
jgi:hypothetical protein